MSVNSRMELAYKLRKLCKDLRTRPVAVAACIPLMQEAADGLDTAKLYYEAHVTLDPVPEAEREALQMVIAQYGFKLAKLLMDKGVPSQLDTFVTGHGKDYLEMRYRIRCVCLQLQARGYKVRRYKLEDTLFDSRTEDVLGLLEPKV